MLTSPEFKLNQIIKGRQEIYGKLRVGMQGKYRFEVRRNGFLIKDTGWIPNLILNQGRVYMMQGNINSGNPDFMGYCHVGSGTSTPAVTQTQLDTLVNAVFRNTGLIPVSNSGAPNYIRSATYTYAFSQGSVIGTIAEVGVGWANTATSLFSRTLVVDGGGNPAPITLTSLDQLTVFYTFSVVPDTAPQVGSVDLEGITYTYTVYNQGLGALTNNFNSPTTQYPYLSVTPQNINSSQIYVGGPGSTITSDLATAGGIINGTVNGSYALVGRTLTQNTATFTQTTTLTIGPGVANPSGGIKCLCVFNWIMGINLAYQYYYFDTVVPKTNTKQLTLVYDSVFI